MFKKIMLLVACSIPIQCLASDPNDTFGIKQQSERTATTYQQRCFVGPDRIKRCETFPVRINDTSSKTQQGILGRKITRSTSDTFCLSSPVIVHQSKAVAVQSQSQPSTALVERVRNVPYKVKKQIKVTVMRPVEEIREVEETKYRQVKELVEVPIVRPQVETREVYFVEEQKAYVQPAKQKVKRTVERNRYFPRWRIRDGKNVHRHLADGFPGKHAPIGRQAYTMTTSEAYRYHDHLHDQGSRRPIQRIFTRPGG